MFLKKNINIINDIINYLINYSIFFQGWLNQKVGSLKYVINYIYKWLFIVIMMIFMLFLKIENDAPKRWQIGFQDPATSIMEGIIELHNNIFFYLIVILILVFWMITIIFLHYSYQFNYLFRKYAYYSILDNIRIETQRRRWTVFYLYVKKNLISQKITHNATLETVWVILPAFILISIALPSFDILYSMDEIFNPEFLIKVVGNQWYWTYEIPAYNLSPNLTVQANSFDALMVPQEDVVTNNVIKGVFRLLDTDLWLCLPAKTHIQVILTSEDVIHSWAVPSLGAKIDCVPGRLNQISLYIKRAGIFYGQCSEICGINHGFMPIKVSAFAIKTWLLESVKLIENLKNFAFHS